VAVQSTAAGTPVTVNGLGGPMGASVGNSATGLTSLNATVDLENPAGTISLTLDDSRDSTAQTISVNGTSVTGLPRSSVSFSTLSDWTVNGGTGGNTFKIKSTTVPTTVNAGTGSGNDTINVGKDGNKLNQINADVTVNGHAGSSDVLIVADNDTLTPESY